MSDYYLPRWRLFLRMLKRGMSKRRKWNQKRFKKKFMSKVGVPFTLGTKTYPHRPTGKAITMAQKVHRKWRKHMVL